jgi:hypothetical protein
MAIKHLSSIDLTGLEVYGLRPEHVPLSQFGLLSTYTGRIVYDSTNNRVKFYNGAEWLDMSGDIREITVGVGLTGGGTADTVDVSINSTIAGNGLTWDGTNGILNVGASDGIEVTGDNVRFKNSPNLTEGTLLYWDDLNTQLQNSRISQVAQSVQGGGTEYTVTINAEQTIMTGSLTVQGVLTSINSNEVNIGDSIIKLNFDEAGAPSQNAGFEVERGTSDNVSFLWDETNDRFTTVDQKLHVGDVESIVGLDNQDYFYMYHNAVGETGVIKKAGFVDVSELMGAPKWWTLDPEQDSVTKASNTYTITHTFNTRAISVQILDSTTYETVHVDVARPTASTVTVAFASSVTDGAYIAILSAAKINGDSTLPEAPQQLGEP